MDKLQVMVVINQLQSDGCYDQVAKGWLLWTSFLLVIQEGHGHRSTKLLTKLPTLYPCISTPYI